MIDLMAVTELILAARHDTADGLTARERLIPVAAAMADEIAVLRETVMAYGEDIADLRKELEKLRRYRLEHPADAVNPYVHTPQRVIAYLRSLGWVREGGAEIAEMWRHPDDPQRQVMLSLHPHAVDYARVTGFLASDIASSLGVGEAQVLADIAAAEVPTNVESSPASSNETGTSVGSSNA